MLLNGLLSAVTSSGADQQPVPDCRPATELQVGQSGTVAQIDEHVRDRAIARGIRPGRTLEVQTKQPFDGPVVVSVDRSVTSISRRCARGIEITVDR